MPVTKRATAPLRGRSLRRMMLAAPAPAEVAASAVPPSADPRIAAIHAAKEGVEIVLAELLHRSDDAGTATEMADLQPEIVLARNTVDDCSQKEIDLTAALTTIALPDPATVAKLQSLGASIDAATVRGAIISATLDGLGAILNSAIRINAML